jgi:hypothetical protein
MMELPVQRVSQIDCSDNNEFKILVTLHHLFP